MWLFSTDSLNYLQNYKILEYKYLVLCLSSTMDVAGQRTHKSKTQISTKMGLTLFSALHALVLQCSTALSNAFRMIYLSIYFEMAWFFGCFIFFIVYSNSFIWILMFTYWSAFHLEWKCKTLVQALWNLPLLWYMKSTWDKDIFSIVVGRSRDVGGTHKLFKQI